MKSLPLLLLLLLCGYHPLVAQSEPSHTPLKMLVEVGYEHGGDELAKVRSSNGTTQRMRAGNGGYVSVGAEYDPAGSPLLFRATIGLKYLPELAKEVDVHFVRYPVNLLAYVPFGPGFRIGGGVTKHLHTRLRGDSLPRDVEFESNWGGRFEIGWRYLAFTYTKMTYRGFFYGMPSGECFGLSFSTTFL